jgi:DNA-binding response OmpR family regulator
MEGLVFPRRTLRGKGIAALRPPARAGPPGSKLQEFVMAGVLAGKTILLVDDDRDILSAMQMALGELGPEILTASDGKDAVTQAEVKPPDLVVLDQMLPKRSGFLVMTSLKRGKQKSDPPRVIMVTGNLGSRHKVYAEGLGVDVYLTKPFRMEKLIEAVCKLMGVELPTP